MQNAMKGLPRDQPPVVLPPGYALYVNERFGFSLAYPRWFRAHVEPDNGGGRSFSSENGPATITACGSNLHSGQTLPDEYVAALNNIRGTITYRRLTPDSFEIAWTDSDSNQDGLHKELPGIGIAEHVRHCVSRRSEAGLRTGLNQHREVIPARGSERSMVSSKAVLGSDKSHYRKPAQRILYRQRKGLN